MDIECSATDVENLAISLTRGSQMAFTVGQKSNNVCFHQ